MAKVVWREQLFKDVIERAQAVGLGFDPEKIEALIREWNEKPAKAPAFPRGIKKHYTRACKMTEKGFRRLILDLERSWPGHTQEKKRKNEKKGPTKKEHPETSGPPPVPTEPPPVPPPPPIPGRHDYGPREALLEELHAAGVHRNDHGPIEKQPVEVLRGMVEKQRQIAEGSYPAKMPPNPNPPPPPPPALCPLCEEVLRSHTITIPDLGTLHSECYLLVKDDIEQTAPPPPPPIPGTPQNPGDLPGTATVIMGGRHVAGPAPTVPPPPPPSAPSVSMPPPPPNAPAISLPPTPVVAEPRCACGAVPESACAPECVGKRRKTGDPCSHEDVVTELGDGEEVTYCRGCGIMDPPPPSMGEQLAEAWTQQNQDDPDPSMVCAECGETGTLQALVKGTDGKKRHAPCHRQRYEHPLTAPAPPPVPAKTYGQPVVPGAPPPVPKLSERCCFTIQIRDPKDESVVADTFNGYLVEQTGFEARVTGAQRLGETKLYDLLVEYSPACHLTDAFKLVINHDWVEDCEAKAPSDFGKVPAM